VQRKWLLACVAIGLAGCGRGDQRPAATGRETRPTAVVASTPEPEPARPPGTPLPSDCTGSQAAADLAAADAPGATLERRIASVVPTPAEEKFLTVPWRTNVMAARDEAQRAGRPLFLWIMVGNPQGCT
jgi:hypothetical protein